MANTVITITTLTGGVGRQDPIKRLTTEVEEMDNCLLTLEKSAEKRPPFSAVIERVGSGTSPFNYLSVPFVDPVQTFVGPNALNGLPSGFNPDNLYFHFTDIDGYNKYCIIVNRAAYDFNPIANFAFTITLNNVIHNITLKGLLTVYRIEPTEWIKEEVDDTQDNGFSRAIFEYITHGNKIATEANPIDYYVAGKKSTQKRSFNIKETFGSIDDNIGIILWNKTIPLSFMPDNSDKDLPSALLIPSEQAQVFTQITTNQFIHSGDSFSYKTTIPFTFTTPNNEDDFQTGENADLYNWENVRDNVSYNVNLVNLSLEENGQNLSTFGVIPQYPASVVKNDIKDLNGYKARRSLYHIYDNPFVISGNFSTWESDIGYLTSSLTPLERDGGDSARGLGKVYYTREGFVSRPAGFYRIVKHLSHPYIQTLRTEGKNSLLDYRVFPIYIYKDTATLKWRVKHLPMKPRTNGTPDSNRGPLAVHRNEKIQSVAFFKNRLWFATDHTIMASKTNDYYNFFITDILTPTDTDTLDVESNVGNFNQLTHMVPFQDFIFIATAGPIQFELRGGDLGSGISPLNVELRPSSFYSTTNMSDPVKMGNSIFFATPGHMLMYLSSSLFNSEFSSSVDMSNSVKGFLPNRPGFTTVSSSSNSIFITDLDNKNVLYIYNSKIQQDKMLFNAFHKWVFNPIDSIESIKAFESAIFFVTKRQSGTAGNSRRLIANYITLLDVPVTAPRLDNLTLIRPVNIEFDETSNKTFVVLPQWDPKIDSVVLHSSWDYKPTDVTKHQLQAYTSVPVVAVETINRNGIAVTRLTLIGNWAYQVRDTINTFLPLWVGRTYKMNIQLSTLFGRDQNNAIKPGVLSLKRMTTTHFDTGQYRIEIERNNREKTSVEFEPISFGDTTDLVGSLRIEKQGELACNILSYSDRCKISIVSDYPTPCNISRVDITANHRLGDTSISK